MGAAEATPHDVVVFGATSFAGRIVCRHLADRHGFDGTGPEGLTWAVAGRSPDRLRGLVADLGDAAGALDVHVADALDDDAMRDLATRARVVVSTVGPYGRYGSGLVAACAEAGADYLDLSGETTWIRRMIDEHHETAAASGARLVPACGFDSVPSDLGVHVLQRHALARFGAPAVRVRMGVRAMRGGMSGGTAASLLDIASQLRSDPQQRRVLANPYALCPPDERDGVRQPAVSRPVHDDEFGRWAAPFVMAAVNTRVVHRTNALLGHPYGADFRYDEVTLTGRGIPGAAKAAATTVGLAVFMGSAATPGLDRLVRRVVPDPGEGPSPQAQAAGFYDLRFHGTTADGDRVEGRVTGDRDPGYGSTGRMLGEAAACLARDVAERTPAVEGGFWTPASLLGDDLVARLEEHAGLTFTVGKDTRPDH